MRRTVSLTKGLNLNLEGGLTSKESVGKACVGRVAVVPDDFPGFVPKLDVKFRRYGQHRFASASRQK